ncbi:S8 family serine peptidase [Chloracidobacterium aggregatum]|uniref:S8 family serine peptidase n=1 Tax=Chloracidobacterium aggregatum TaxID=2851959 RepID=UPI001FE83C5C|nr:S8 family serine peptidase [Chloracidobacterium aggregatum]
MFVCAVCHYALDDDLRVPASAMSRFSRDVLHLNLPHWDEREGVCRDCLDRFTHARSRVGLYLPTPGGVPLPRFKILPTPLRLGASPRYTGRGVTIAFLDSGFYPHPDITQPVNRILHYHNVLTRRADLAELATPDDSSWHGLMTSVVAAGNGFQSRGLYRGIASSAKLVLVKVGTTRRIYHDDIRRGLDWVYRHRHRFGIRIVNISCGGDYEASYLTDSLSQSAERLVKAGVVVVAASGNAGHQREHPVLPPASAPSVIAVGGFDDKNTLDPSEHDVYHSSYGVTVDGLQKPEIIAPSIWIAAPILPGTPTAQQAALYEQLSRAPDGELRTILARHTGIDAELDAAAHLEPYQLRLLVEGKMRNEKVISGHYKHVDGTSFAAPIVSSIVAQMLEVNPRLTPQQVKRILIRTARRLPNIEADRQGWGVVNARLAVAAALNGGDILPSGHDFHLNGL